MSELSTERELEPIVINMDRARGPVQRRFLVVGIFLSVIAITSKNLVDSMRRIWNIRGHLDSNQLLDRRFFLEFYEEGDFMHVIKGGPWRYREDPVLVMALKDGDDPETVKFTTVPTWVQFKNIPFYLLSKELARDLGNRIGELICIDEDARGDLSNMKGFLPSASSVASLAIEKHIVIMLKRSRKEDTASTSTFLQLLGRTQGGGFSRSTQDKLVSNIVQLFPGARTPPATRNQTLRVNSPSSTKSPTR
jgi:hypothetical protein